MESSSEPTLPSATKSQSVRAEEDKNSSSISCDSRAQTWGVRAFDSEKPRIYTWNVNGLTSKSGRKNLRKFLSDENPDILCLNKTQLDAKDLASSQTRDELNSSHYLQYWNCVKPDSKGPADNTGTAILTKVKPLEVSFGMGSDEEDSDSEGRVITMEFGKFILVSCYSPSSHDPDKLEYKTLKWDRALHNYLQALVAKRHKYVILCGDLSSAHPAIDNPTTPHRKNGSSPALTVPLGIAGTLDNDRLSGLLNFGFADSFRRLHPKEVKYTCWNLGANPRLGSKGWRFDYFMVNNGILDAIEESDMLTTVMGSDHCPIKLVPNLAKIQEPTPPMLTAPGMSTRETKRRELKAGRKQARRAELAAELGGRTKVEEVVEDPKIRKGVRTHADDS